MPLNPGVSGAGEYDNGPNLKNRTPSIRGFNSGVSAFPACCGVLPPRFRSLLLPDRGHKQEQGLAAGRIQTYSNLNKNRDCPQLAAASLNGRKGV